MSARMMFLNGNGMPFFILDFSGCRKLMLQMKVENRGRNEKIEFEKAIFRLDLKIAVLLPRHFRKLRG
jgi:hypothetical protein